MCNFQGDQNSRTGAPVEDLRIHPDQQDSSLTVQSHCAKMAPYPDYESDLQVMEISQIPLTLELLTAQYKKLCKIRHPDKNHNPDDNSRFTELFQELGNSFERLKKYLLEIIDINELDSDSDEAKLYEFYTTHNVVKDNVGSVTILIEKSLVPHWDRALVDFLGQPISRSKNEGIRWKVPNYQDSGKEISVTMWEEPRDDKPKILCQAGGEFDKLFSTVELPLIYSKVIELSNSAQSPVFTKTKSVKNKRNTFMKTPRGYLTHPKRHSSVMTPLPRASKRLKQKSPLESEASFLSSPAAKVPMPTSQKSYPCSSCPQKFKERSHLEEHRKALHSQIDKPALVSTSASIASEPTPPGPQSIALPGLSRVNNSPGPPGPPRVNSSSSSNPELTIRDETISTIVPPPVLNTTPEEEDVTVEELDEGRLGTSGNTEDRGDERSLG